MSTTITTEDYTMTTSYSTDATDDAKETVREYLDAIVDQIVDSGEASDDLLNDYGNGDRWHHESHVDKSYDLQEAAQLLSELSDHEETDSGLWEGQAPREAIATQAAFTYGNAVYSEWRDLIERINDEYGDLSPDLDALETEAEVKRERLEQLENAEELSDEEAAERDALAARQDDFSEDAVAAEKRERIEAMVRGIIE